MPKEYSVEFDLIDGHSPLTGAELGPMVLKAYGWRSIGAINPSGTKKGGRFTNKTGFRISAIYLKANNPGDTFKIVVASAGRLFNTIWLKNDNTEVYFMDGNIPVFDGTSPDLGVFWMYVPRNEEEDIRKCTKCHFDNPTKPCIDSCPFTGQVFETNPPDPPAQQWTKIKHSQTLFTGKWKPLTAACPSAFREIQAYCESPDGRLVMFVSQANLLLYDDKNHTVSLLAAQDTELATVNRIEFEQGSFQLLNSGTVIQTINPSKDKFIVVGRL